MKYPARPTRQESRTTALWAALSPERGRTAGPGALSYALEAENAVIEPLLTPSTSPRP